MVLGNKIDLENRTVSTKRAQSWCQSKNDIPYFEVSAKDAINVEQAFQVHLYSQHTSNKNAFVQKIARDALARESAQDNQEFPSFNDQIRLNNTSAAAQNQSGCNC